MNTTNQAQVDDFNRAYPAGYPVRYWTGDREGEGKVSTTRSGARLLGGHTAVVWVEGVASCIALTHVEPFPDQPDGIEEDSHDLPDPIAAARRVGDYIAECGDGLYNVQAGKPLYGRDLEAICRAILAWAAG